LQIDIRRQNNRQQSVCSYLNCLRWKDHDEEIMPANQSAWNVTTASWTESIVATAETPENGSTEAVTNRVLPPRFRPPNMQLLDNSAIVIGSVGVTAGAVHGRRQGHVTHCRGLKPQNHKARPKPSQPVSKPLPSRPGADLRSDHLCSGRRGPCHMVLGGP